MTAQERYAKALKELLEAQREVQAQEDNPFNFGLPTHLGLDNETFITDQELENLASAIEQASIDNQKFAKIWNVGTDMLLKAKALLL